MTVQNITSTLLKGDALEPSFSDLIVQEGRLDVGLPVPDGWRVLDGNMHSSAVARVVMRHEVQSMDDLLTVVKETVG